MREMRVGDKVFFYHSNCDAPAIVGIAEVARAAHPDHTQFDPMAPHYEPKATKEKPLWDMVDVRAVSAFRTPVSLSELQDPDIGKDGPPAQRQPSVRATRRRKGVEDHL